MTCIGIALRNAVNISLKDIMPDRSTNADVTGVLVERQLLTHLLKDILEVIAAYHSNILVMHSCQNAAMQIMLSNEDVLCQCDCGKCLNLKTNVSEHPLPASIYITELLLARCQSNHYSSSSYSQ